MQTKNVHWYCKILIGIQANEVGHSFKNWFQTCDKVYVFFIVLNSNNEK